MAILTYPASDPVFKWYGRELNDPPYKWLWAKASEVVFVARGTSCTAIVIPSMPFTVSVDGGAANQPSFPGGSTDASVTIFTGLSDADHLVVVKAIGNSKLREFTVTGAVPSIRSATAAEGYGPYLRIGDAGFVACGSVDNMSAINVGDGYNDPLLYCNTTSTTARCWVNGGFRFRARTNTIRIWLYQSGVGVQMLLQKDGVSQGGIVTGVVSTGWCQLATELDDGSEHIYTVIYKNTSFTDAVLLGGANAGFSAVPVPDTGRFGFYGDSITVGDGCSNTLVNWTHLLCSSLKKVEFNIGISSSRVQGGDATDGSIRFGDIGSISPDPEACFVLYGTNDLLVSGGSSVPTAPFGSGFVTMLNGLLNGTVPTKFYVMGILPIRDKTLAVIAAWNGAGNGVQGSIAAVAAARPQDAARLEYVDTSGWGLEANNYAIYYIADGVHPNDAGAALIFQKLLDVLVPPKGANFGVGTYGLLYQITQNTAGSLPVVGDGVYALACKVVRNTGGNTTVGDSLYNLFYKIAGNTAGISPQLGDRMHTLLGKIAQNTGANSPRVGDGRYNMLSKISENTE